MKKFTLSSTVFSAVVLLLFTTAVATSCKKDKTCHGTVHVLDSTGNAVSGAAVKLDASGSDVIYESTTDGSGTATFEVKLPAIFDITATKATPALSGDGVLRLDEAGKSNDVTITVH